MSSVKLMKCTCESAVTRRAAGRTAALLSVTIASLGLPSATELSAQAPGTVTVGLFAQRTAFDQLTTLRFGTAPGIGGTIGVHVFRGLVVEAATSYTWTSPAVPPRVHASWKPYRARAVYHDGVATALIDNPDVRVRVNGHTDSTGNRAYNLTLSQNRAESVVEYLATRGVDAARMEAQGFGPDQPVATNATADGRRMNRRVELERINQ